MIAPPEGLEAKRKGAYYTPAPVAEFLVHWALRSGRDTLIDPSFGGGVFLRAALARLRDLGGLATNLYGVELDAEVYRAVQASLKSDKTSPQLLNRDFFGLAPADLPAVDAVVGNPPFIRYQAFQGSARQRALRASQAQGVTLSGLSSAWAPFVVHSCAHLKRGGRLAMVIPAELGHAAYARPVLEHLTANFARTLLVSFRNPLFPQLSQDTLLVLAEGKGATQGELSLLDVDSAAELSLAALERAERIPSQGLIEGKDKLPFYWLPQEARQLYKTLIEHECVRPLGDLAGVSVGYVTGANRFFHLGDGEAKSKRLPSRYLWPAVFRSAALAGLTFTQDDWDRAERLGDAGYLLTLDGAGRLPAPVHAYLGEGEALGVPDAYKCRIRQPWYAVPHVRSADAFLSYMSSERPKFVVNGIDAVAPNSLHVVTLPRDSAYTAQSLAVAWQTSLSALSAELEGHALGGGMLKLEPGEAKKVLIALPCGVSDSVLAKLHKPIDAALRHQDWEAALDFGDNLVLRSGLNLSTNACRALRQSYNFLRARRTNR